VIRRFVRSLIESATVTAASETPALRLDPVLMNAMEIRTFEEIEVVNVATGARVSTWVEAGGPGEVRVAHMRTGDRISIVCHGWLHDGQTLAHRAKVIAVDAANRVLSLTES
jgi:aspartate 1-decarboxylase